MPKDLAFERSNSTVTALVGKWEDTLKKRGKSAALFSVAIPLAACSGDGEVSVGADDLANLGLDSIGSGTGGQGGSNSNTIGGATNTNTLTPGDVNVNVDVNVDANGNGDDEALATLLSLLIQQFQAQNELMADQNDLMSDQLEQSVAASNALLAQIQLLVSGIDSISGSLETLVEQLNDNLLGLIDSVDGVAGSIDSMTEAQIEFFTDMIEQASNIYTTLAAQTTIMSDESMIRRGVIENGEGSADNGDLFLLTAGGDAYVNAYGGSANDDVFLAPLVNFNAGITLETGFYNLANIPVDGPGLSGFGVTGPFVASSLNGTDHLDGGAGDDDTLYVWTNMFTGLFTSYMPKIENIEVIKITVENVDASILNMLGSLIGPGLPTLPISNEGSYQVAHYDFSDVEGLRELWSSNTNSSAGSNTPGLHVDEIQNMIDLYVQNAEGGHEVSIYYAANADFGVAPDNVEQDIFLVGSNGDVDNDGNGDAVEIYVGENATVATLTTVHIEADQSENNNILLEDGNVGGSSGDFITKIKVDASSGSVADGDNIMMRLDIDAMSKLAEIDASGYDSGVWIDLSDQGDVYTGEPPAWGDDADTDGVKVITGDGDDYIIGSEDTDTFVFTIATMGHDTIENFEANDVLSFVIAGVAETATAAERADALADAITSIHINAGTATDAWDIEINFGDGNSLTLLNAFTNSSPTDLQSDLEALFNTNAAGVTLNNGEFIIDGGNDGVIDGVDMPGLFAPNLLSTTGDILVNESSIVP